MKKMIYAAVCFFFLLITAAPGIAKDYNRRNANDRHNAPPAVKDRRDNSRRPADRGRREYKGPFDHRGYKGYREQPYDTHRHYAHRDYHGRRYTYRGHWRSWKQWDGYARRHPEIYKHGRYYREDGHLMFRFCEPATGNCLFFSIGG